MHRKGKVLIARWLASRIESRTRRVRRALRDHQRAELRRIHASDRRARGLQLYAAWSCKENKAMNYRTVVPLHRHPEKSQHDEILAPTTSSTGRWAGWHPCINSFGVSSVWKKSCGS